jgi:hypothetical protein
MKKPAPESSLAWAWEIADGRGGWTLCCWAEPSMTQLLAKPKPSPEARPVCVRITRNSEARR